MAEYATYMNLKLSVTGGKIVKEREPWPVRVMARAEGYAMVRRKGCAPFVCSQKELEPAAQQQRAVE